MKYRKLNHFERCYGEVLDNILRTKEIPPGFEFYCSTQSLDEALVEWLYFALTSSNTSGRG